MFFNKKYQSENSGGAFITLDYNQVIFVLEDVDASSKVVRDRALVAAEIEAENDAELDKASLYKEVLEERVKDAIVKEGKEATPERIKRRLVLASAKAPAPHRTRTKSTVVDALNLTGLLNALDGVVASPGRIVIMTTNHPEMLDPALTRPGRIDKQLVMGYMIPAEMAAMIEHYYEIQLSDADKDRLKMIVNDYGLEMTAAHLEQLAIEVDRVPDLLELLECRAREAAAAQTKNNEENESPSTTLNA